MERATERVWFFAGVAAVALSLTWAVYSVRSPKHSPLEYGLAILLLAGGIHGIMRFGGSLRS